MKTRSSYAPLLALLAASSAHTQTPAPKTEAELAKETALLKAQQLYFDQLALTTKSQQTANDATIAAQTASITAATQLQNAQYANDLALATALKASGLPAATGKEGAIAIAATEKTMLAMQRGSLEAIDIVSKNVCEEVTKKISNGEDGKPLKAFIAPANYEQLVQKSIADITQLTSLHSAAVSGEQEFKSVNMQVAGTALAGALVSAQYIAGGVQAITKLFRTDYNLAFTPNARQGLFEQTLTASCSSAILGNVEGKLRLGAAKLLNAWLPNMARFSQQYDMWSERITQRKAELNARKTEIAAPKPTAENEKKEQAAALKQISDALAGFADQEQMLAKYKAVNTSIKAYLTAVNSGTVHESLLWGQEYLHRSGGLPTEIENLRLENRPRLSYTLNVQDTSVTAKSTFFADRVRYFSTAEIYFTLNSSSGDPLTMGVFSKSTAPKDLKVKEVKGEDYLKVY